MKHNNVTPGKRIHHNARAPKRPARRPSREERRDDKYHTWRRL